MEKQLKYNKINSTIKSIDFDLFESFLKKILFTIYHWYQNINVEPIDNIEDLYVLGRPIKTDIGICHFIKVHEFEKLMKYLDLLTLQKFQIIRYYDILLLSKDMSDNEKLALKELIKTLKTQPLIKYIKEINRDVHKRFNELFFFCFKNDVFDLIETDEELEFYRDLIIKMNNLPVIKENPNPEIEEYNRLEREMSSQQSGHITFTSIYTSVWGFTGKEPKNMTMYQMYKLFDRISYFKNHHVTALFRTVSNEVKIQNWYDDIKNTSRDRVTTLEQLEKESRAL
jgi:Ca2+-binding EF-hand superfamily protein